MSPREVTLHTASYRAWRPGLGAPVVTSLQVPRWLPEAEDWPQLWAASPRWAYFSAPAVEFDKCYLAQLDRAGPKQIAGVLAEIANVSGAARLVLLCFEADPAACHRSLFAAWWLATTGERITEFT
jgi:hypothetical protein